MAAVSRVTVKSGYASPRSILRAHRGSAGARDRRGPDPPTIKPCVKKIRGGGITCGREVAFVSPRSDGHRPRSRTRARYRTYKCVHPTH